MKIKSILFAVSVVTASTLLIYFSPKKSYRRDYQIEVIEPIVLAEREVVSGDAMYKNEDYVHLLQQQYPSATIIHYNPNEIDLISI